MHAAIVEFNPLPNPIRPAAENHDLPLGTEAWGVGRGAWDSISPAPCPLPPAPFIKNDDRTLIRRVIIRRLRLELRRAGVHEVVDRGQTPVEPPLTDGAFVRAPERCELAVAEALRFGAPQQVDASGLRLRRCRPGQARAHLFGGGGQGP